MKADNSSTLLAFGLYFCPHKKTAQVKQKELIILSHIKRISIILFNTKSQKVVIYSRW